MSGRRDVAVIGGGLLGCAVALALARDGVDVVLLERDQINEHASGRNAGSLHFQLEYRMIERGLDAARVAAQAMPLHLEAAGLWRALSDEIGEPLGVTQHGGLMLAHDTPSARLLEAKTEIERSHGLEVQLLSAREVRDTAPYLSSSVVAASFCPLEGKANARTAAPALARAAIAAGAEVRTRTAVTDIAASSVGWSISTRMDAADDGSPTGTLQTETIILAAGVWTVELAALMGARLPLQTMALMMTVTARTDHFVPHLVQHAGARLSLKQADGGNILIGGGWPARPPTTGRETEWARPAQLLPESVAGNAAAAIAAVPQLETLPVLRSWIGTTALASDQLPVVGPIPGARSAFVATGGSAFTLGLSFAAVLSELVQGQTPHLDLSAYDPGRFHNGPSAVDPGKVV